MYILHCLRGKCHIYVAYMYQKHGSVFIRIFKADSTWYLVSEVCFLASSFYSFMGETVDRCFYVCTKALVTHVFNQSWPPNVIYLRITFVLLWASGRPTKLLLILKAMSYTFVLLCVLLWASIQKYPSPILEYYHVIAHFEKFDILINFSILKWFRCSSLFLDDF